MTEVVDGGGGLLAYVVHDVAELDLDPAEAVSAWWSGRSHRPASDERDSVLGFNPGERRAPPLSPAGGSPKADRRTWQLQVIHLRGALLSGLWWPEVGQVEP